MQERIETASKPKGSEQLKLTDLVNKSQHHIDAGEFLQARALVKSGLAKWPDALRLQLMNAELLEAEGRGDQAINALRRSAEKFPGNLQPATALVHACLRQGQYEQARTALSAARNRGLEEETTLRLELLVAKADNSWGDVAASAEKIIDRDGKRLAQVLLTLAQARLQTKDAAGAHEAALRALANDPKLVSAALVASHAAVELGNPADMVNSYRTLGRLAPDDTRWPLKIVATLSVSGRYHEAVEELEAILERWPSNMLVRKFLQRSPLGGTLLEEAIRAMPEVPDGPDGSADDEDEDDTPRQGTKRDTAKSAAIANVQTTARNEMTALRALFDKGPSDAELLRPVVVDSLQSEVLIGERKTAETVVFVFTAVNDRMWMPLTMFDRYLAALGVTAVYLKDFQRLLHLNGVKSLAEGYGGTVAKLRELAARFGARRICTVGHSGGARPAIRYGVELGADRIVSFGGATGRTPCLMGTDRQFNGIIWKRATDNIPEEMLDLKPFLANRPHASKITLAFGQEIESERTDAHYLEGLPGVTLHPVAGMMRDTVLRTLAETGDLRQRLAVFLGLDDPGSARR